MSPPESEGKKYGVRWAINFTGQQDLQVEKVAGPTQKLPAVGLRTCGNPEHWDGRTDGQLLPTSQLIAGTANSCNIYHTSFANIASWQPLLYIVVIKSFKNYVFQLIVKRLCLPASWQIILMVKMI